MSTVATTLLCDDDCVSVLLASPSVIWRTSSSSRDTRSRNTDSSPGGLLDGLLERPRGRRARSTGTHVAPSRWQLVHGLSLSHLTLRWRHSSQVNRTQGLETGPASARFGRSSAIAGKMPFIAPIPGRTKIGDYCADIAIIGLPRSIVAPCMDALTGALLAKVWDDMRGINSESYGSHFLDRLRDQNWDVTGWCWTERIGWLTPN